MMQIRSALKSVCAVAAVATAAACAPSATTTVAAGEAPAAAVGPATPEMIAEGRTLFASTGRCAVCHGQGGRGGSLGPNLQDDEWLWVEPAQPLRPQVAAIIRTGIEEPREFPAPMPAMGGGNLTEQQVAALAAFVESL